MTRDWQDVDWTKQDLVIARELDVSRERVRQVRVKLGKAASPNKGKWTSETGEERLLKAFSPELTVDELAKRSGLSVSTTGDVLRRHNLKALSRVFKHDWASVDWSRLNTEIARELGCWPPLVSKRRSQYAPEQYKRSPYLRKT